MELFAECEWVRPVVTVPRITTCSAKRLASDMIATDWGGSAEIEILIILDNLVLYSNHRLDFTLDLSLLI